MTRRFPEAVFGQNYAHAMTVGPAGYRVLCEPARHGIDIHSRSTELSYKTTETGNQIIKAAQGIVDEIELATWLRGLHQ